MKIIPSKQIMHKSIWISSFRKKFCKKAPLTVRQTSSPNLGKFQEEMLSQKNMEFYESL